MSAYYNEIDPAAAQWLRNLIEAGHIAPGYVDERSIEDVTPEDLAGYTQCHFFAGIGVWSYALRRAGWSDDRPVWTGSCPCQPFSSAGAQAGFDDERHLWPHFQWLIEKCRPAVIVGEQVASKAVEPWIDLVQTDLEGLGYAFAGIPFPSAGVGAPHIRDRLFWVADAESFGRADGPPVPRSSRQISSEAEQIFGIGDRCSAGGLADTGGNGRDQRRQRVSQAGSDGPVGDHGVLEGQPTTGPINGFWEDADWLFCRDGKWRPVEASPQPLADGSAESLGRVCPEVVAQAEKAVNETSMEAQIEPAALLRNLLDSISAEAKRLWPAGGLPGLHEAPFLLAFLRQLSEQGWGFAQDCALPRPKATQVELRGLRCDEPAAGASYQRGLEGQPPGEHSDPVHLLSSLLACAAQEEWGDAYEAYAEIGFPLGHNTPARVVRLRAYGNAINAEAAREFIGSVMECIG